MMTTEATSDRSPDDVMDADKEARLLLNPPSESVQFTQNTNTTNGQVILPTNNRSTGVGMTKQELMKYANDPFWIRLRMSLFILFWLVWFAMLIGSILIIALAPGCPATASLPWWKKCSLLQVGASQSSSNATPLEKIEKANKDIENLQNNLPVLSLAKLDGFVLTGLDPFLFAPDNVTKDASDKLKDDFTKLVTDIHGEFKGKIIVDLKLSDTSNENPLFVNALKQKTLDHYFLRTAQPNNTAVNWNFDVDSKVYYASQKDKRPKLNYSSPEVLEQIKSLVLTWVRTKIDGVQSDSDFFASIGNGPVQRSEEALTHLHKWVKSGGQNKALLLTDSAKPVEHGKPIEDDESKFQLKPDGSLWKQISQASNIKEALQKAFSHYVELEKETIDNANATKDEKAEKINVGLGWRSLQVVLPSSKKNSITNKTGQSIAEGVLAAFFLIPKSTPIVQIDDIDEIVNVNNDKFLAKLNELRVAHSESFLLGSTQLPTTSSDKVFAVSRVYKDKNTFLLLINFDSSEVTVEVKGNFPDAILFTPQIVLSDTKSPGTASSIPFSLSAVKLAPKQVLLIEFAPIKE